MEFSKCLDDDTFGPAVHGCRGDFDFTLYFERLFLSIIPHSVFITIVILRTTFLLFRPKVVVRGIPLLAAKLTGILTYSGLQISLASLSTSWASLNPFLSSTVVSAVFAICLAPLSLLEHSRAARPSFLLNICLSINLLLGIVQTRSLWLAAADSGVQETIFTRLLTASVVTNAFLVLLESQNKSRWILWKDDRTPCPEETCGVFGLGTFIWMRQLFLDGYNKVLSLDDLFPLDQELSVEALQPKIRDLLSSGAWSNNNGLAIGLGKILVFPLVLPVIPRLCLVGFRFSQPLFIEALLSYLQEIDAAKSKGYGLIGAAVLIYSGIAVSNALYWYYHERTLCKARSVLVTAVYEVVTRAQVSASNSDAITLMSTDIEQITQGFLNFHEFWANALEICLAVWLLERQLGLASLAPIVTVLTCVVCSVTMLRLVGTAQEAWMKKTQERVGLTGNVVTSMKLFKISALTDPIEDLLQKMRVTELRAASRIRLILIAVATLGYAPMAISPVVTFALTSRTLDVSTIFTSMSYLVLLADPLGNLFEAGPTLMAGLACLRRIQTFLQQEPKKDLRRSRANVENIGIAVSIRDGCFGWDTGKLVLHNINIDIMSSCLTVVVGPVASGKSTLCKALLGELPGSSGQILVSSDTVSERIAYCDQIPYLANHSVRKNIIGFSPFDSERYEEVIHATMLQADLDRFVSGDETVIGSSGIAVSGGQRQRISIARALYLLDTNFFIFDDVLSGLDEHTAEQVFNRVFGPNGVLRRRNATVILCTHTVRWLPSADRIIVLNSSGGVAEQSVSQNLAAIEKHVHDIGIDADAQLEADLGKTLESTTAAHAMEASQGGQGDQSRVKVGSGVYRRYISTLGKRHIFSFLIFGIGWGFFYNWGTIWLKFWSEDSSSNPTRPKSFYLGMYGLFQTLYLASLFFALFICLRPMIQTSGARLHQTALHTLVTARLRLFSSTDHGVITTLFSQDMTLIDGELPIATVNLALDSFNATGMAVVIATSSPYLALAYPIIAAILYMVQKFYLRTSRQLRLLDLESKSPLYTQFLDTLRGVVTFRAFGWVQDNIKLNSNLLDTSQRPAYLLAMAQRCLGFAVQALTAVLAVAVVTLATQLRSNSAFTGASLVSLMSYGDILVFIVRWYTQLETCIGAVGRLKTFSDNTKVEDADGSVVLDEKWPSRGEIVLRGASATYEQVPLPCPRGQFLKFASAFEEASISSHPRAPVMVLRNLSFRIQSGSKVAICGRTGSGKSSLVLLLLRLLDPVAEDSHSITIDDISIHNVDPSTLRHRIIAVPQDPVFLPDGTSFAFNLDPLERSTESECREVLNRVGLLDHVDDCGGITAGISADTLSQGQKQLFNIARAILRRRIRARAVDEKAGVSGSGGVLLLDEISASLDQHTEEMVQRIIEEEFDGYTVVMISHRLEPVLRFDTVLVMDRGSMVESGSPAELLQKEGGRFRDLWMEKQN